MNEADDRSAAGRDDFRVALAWAGAAVTTLVTAGIALELAKHGILLVQGIYFGLPYRISVSVGSIVLFGVLFVGPATIARLLWTWLYRRTDRSTVTRAFLVQLLVIAVVWPALLAREIGILLGR